MEKYVDWSTFNKLDNAASIDFLSSVISVLAESNQYPERELHSLKQTLANNASAWSQAGKSIVGMLNDESSQALDGLVLRYGVTNFTLNHTRFTLKPLLLDLNIKLCQWADVCLKKSELVFNRSFFVWQDSGVERRELFSQVLFSLASQVNAAVLEIDSAVSQISTLRPSDILDVTGDVEKLDAEISNQIGFSGIENLGSFCRAEIRCVKKLSLALSELVEGVSEILSQLIPNCAPSNHLIETNTLCEVLATEVQRFSAMTFPKSNSTLVWEMRRRAICFSVYNVGLILSDLSASFSQSIAPIEHKNSDLYLSKDVERRLASLLFSQGSKIAVSQEAAKSLLNYCVKHQVKPSEIIPAELKKIHPLLNAASLDLLIELTDQKISTTPGGGVSKKRLSDETKKIRSQIGSVLTILFFIVSSSLVPVFTSCGLKTDIKSDVEDLRPALPPTRPEQQALPVLPATSKDSKNDKR